ncbi:hypothetical protein [Noviherbaspirillum humi]|uniref:hypothetical protein n=1 Tax=Noviherbaspirillum humi TaxID=1688639 RepID=UPI001595E5FE|nr:hypothetical protein [Noviherbaspirillum humi]
MFSEVEEESGNRIEQCGHAAMSLSWWRAPTSSVADGWRCPLPPAMMMAASLAGQTMNDPCLTVGLEMGVPGGFLRRRFRHRSTSIIAPVERAPLATALAMFSM